MLIFIPPFWAVLHILGLFNRKVARGIAGRKTLFADLDETMAAMPPGPRVWVHASSMGEFEQAKPIIAALKARHPEVRIIASFFSPSGYEHSRKYTLADAIVYIPFDSPRRRTPFPRPHPSGRGRDGPLRHLAEPYLGTACTRRSR